MTKYLLVCDDVSCCDTYYVLFDTEKEAKEAFDSYLDMDYFDVKVFVVQEPIMELKAQYG